MCKINTVAMRKNNHETCCSLRPGNVVLSMQYVPRAPRPNERLMSCRGRLGGRLKVSDGAEQQHQHQPLEHRRVLQQGHQRCSCPCFDATQGSCGRGITARCEWVVCWHMRLSTTGTLMHPEAPVPVGGRQDVWVAELHRPCGRPLAVPPCLPHL